MLLNDISRCTLVFHLLSCSSMIKNRENRTFSSKILIAGTLLLLCSGFPHPMEAPSLRYPERGATYDNLAKGEVRPSSHA